MLGVEFDLYTDCGALSVLGKPRSELNRRQVRSLETIEEYSGMKMHHIAGKKNVVADALTRVPTKDCFCVRPLLLDSLVPVYRATGFQTRWTKKIKMAITHQSRRIYKF